MDHNKYQQDIEDLNRRYLNLAREMVREDPEQAFALLGVNAPLRESIKELTLNQIDKLAAEVRVTCFSMRINERHFGKLVKSLDMVEDAELGFALSLISAASAIGQRG